MFEAQPQAEIEAMMKANSEFRQLYFRHRELDKQVLDAELGVLPIDDATLDRARSALRALHDAGLLTDAQLAKALAVCTQNDKVTTWNAATPSISAKIQRGRQSGTDGTTLCVK